MAGSSSKSIFSIFGSGRAIWLVAIGLGVVTLLGVMSLLASATATSTYYVLGEPVAVRSEITPEMMVAVTVSEGGQPGNAYDLVYIQNNQLFAQVSLKRGDVVSASNAGPATRLVEGLPENFVAASFAVDAAAAVGGKLRAGDYIDIIALDEASGGAAGLAGEGSDRLAKVVLNRVFVLDVSVSADTLQDAATEEVGSATQEEEQVAVGGVPALYTVAVSPEDAVTIAQIRDKNMFVVLSSLEPQDQQDAQKRLSDIFNDDPVPNSSEGIVPGGKEKDQE